MQVIPPMLYSLVSRNNIYWISKNQFRLCARVTIAACQTMRSRTRSEGVAGVARMALFSTGNESLRVTWGLG